MLRIEVWANFWWGMAMTAVFAPVIGTEGSFLVACATGFLKEVVDHQINRSFNKYELTATCIGAALAGTWLWAVTLYPAI